MIMHYISDYIDLTNENKPYESEKEHREDYLRLFEYILEEYINARSIAGEKYYTPGIILTDEQAEYYYETRPINRKSSVYNQELANEVSKARDFIKKREEATKDEVLLPIKKIREEFDLTFLEELALLTALALAVDVNRRNLYAYIANDAMLKYSTAGILYSLYSLICEDADISLFEELCRLDGKMRVCFFKKTDSSKISSIMDEPIVLRSDILGYLLGKKISEDIPFGDRHYYDELDLEVFSKIREAFPSSNENSMIYIESKDPLDVPVFLEMSGYKNILILNLDILQKDIDKNGYASNQGAIALRLGRLIVNLKLQSGNLCIKTGEKTDYNILNSVIFVLRKYINDRNLFIFGNDKAPQYIISGKNTIYVFKLPYPDVEEREKLWNYFLYQTGLKLADNLSVSDLADCYELSLNGIHQIVDRVQKQVLWSGQDEIEKSDLKEQLFAYGDSGLSILATFIPSTFTWDDLQIDSAQRDILMVACERFRHRRRIENRLWKAERGAYGNGVSVLLCGPPGTGKTMAAQVVSEELQLPLYRIDVSQIYSKYLGETQKNLGEVFDQAKKTNAILFFDEADALFSKRTDVNDSHDKYANAETAYLLQKIESHNGMVLLATNLFQNFDMAFVRRLTYVVRFSKPDENIRLALWKSILPKTMKIADDIDYEFFAENFDLSGSSIKSILYSAMYMAAAHNRELTNKDIVYAMKYEFEKDGILNDPSKFGRYSVYIIE